MSVRIGHRGDRWFELGDWHALAGEALRFEDDARALLFLRRQAEAGDVRRLRALLTRDNAMTQRLDDAVVLRLVAHRLHVRTLKAVAWFDRRFSFVATPALVQAPRVEIPAAAPRSPLQFEARPEPAPAAPTAPAFEQPLAQAQALRAAARTGVPFCAVCQPPVERPQASEPPPGPQLAVDGDAEAQAQALVAAASLGAPFCAVCKPPAARARAAGAR